MSNIITSPKDHDFIKTEENFFFCVIGYAHPQDRIISYLKYIPSPDGKWKKEDISLKRVINHYSASEVLQTYQYLGFNYQKYLYDCPVTKIQITAVPYNSIKEYYKPQNKVKNLYAILEEQKIDKLQKKAIDFIEFLASHSKINRENFGITGSILTDFHNIAFSDIDLTVHGRKNSRIIENVVKAQFEMKKSEITRLPFELAKSWQRNKIKVFNFDEKQAKLLFERKWNMGNFRRTRFSIHPIRNDNEIIEKYGDLEYFPKGIIEIEGNVTHDEDSIFLPCKYEISDVKILEGQKIEDVVQICSYEGLYCFMVKKGERFRARGKLEKVIDKKRNNTYHRLLIGSYLAKSRDFLLPIDSN